MTDPINMEICERFEKEKAEKNAMHTASKEAETIQEQIGQT